VWVDRFLANQGNFELKIFTMDAKYYFEDLSRKKSRKNYKDAPRDLEPILDRMDDFLTSDTLENSSCDIMYADYGFINERTTFFRYLRSQIQ